MATKTFEIARYTISLGGQQLLTYDNRAITVYSIIQCEGVDGQEFDILITPDWASLPPYTEISSNNTVGKIVASPERYAWFVDLIRNEGPIIAVIDNSTPMNNRLTISGA
jgi:hypothetical protein